MADRTNRRKQNTDSRKSASDRVIYLGREEMTEDKTRTRRASKRGTTSRNQRSTASGRRSNRADTDMRSTASRSQVRTRTSRGTQTANERQTRRTSSSAGRSLGTRRQQASSRDTRQRTTATRRQPVPRTRTRSEAYYVPDKRKRPRKQRRGIIFGNILPPINLRYATDASGEERKRRTSSRMANNSGMLVVVAMLFLLILVYIGGYAVKHFKHDEIAYETIQVGSIDSAKSADGVIIRSEKVFTAAASGTVQYSVSENEKIKKNTEVCSISDAQTVAELQERLDSINEDIMKQQENREELSEHTEEVKKLESQIKTLIDDDSFSYVSDDFSELYTLKTNIQKKLDTRNQLLLTENSSSLSSLVGQRTNELKQISDNTNTIVSDVGGIVSYCVDGNEADFTPENMTALTKEQISKKSDTTASIKTNVAAGDAVFKVITSNEWYIASYMPDSYTDGWKQEGDEDGPTELDIYVDSGVDGSRTLAVTVYSLTHGDKEAYVIFKTSQFMSDYLDVRSLSFEVDKPRSGYKIPNTAISQQTLLKVPVAYYDSENGSVLKVTDSGDKVVEVNCAGNDDEGEYALIAMQAGVIGAGDTVKISGSDKTYTISDVVTENGVFLVNSGVTDFVKINLTGSTTNGDYTVLDESVNSSINIYDRIVQNVANVQENQNIYE